MKRRGTMTELVKLILKALAGLILSFLVALGKFLLFTVLVGLPIMLLWNAFCPDLFHVPEIGFWQAVGLYLLAHCLFHHKG